MPTVSHNDDRPGDRDDNLWVTIDDYQPPQSQIEWEQTCFLDQSFYGYYCWPKIIKYSINKRERYTLDNMPEEAAVLYNRFSDRSFLKHVTELMLLDEAEDEDFDFNEIRFAMYKVNRKIKSTYSFNERIRSFILGSLSQFWPCFS